MDRRQILIIIAWALSAFLGGCARQYFEPGVNFSVTSKVTTVVTALLAFSWYYLDSNNINYKRGPFLNIAVVGLTLVALPYYFLKSRGFKIGGIFTLAFLSAIAGWYALVNAGGYVVYHGIQS